MEKLRTGIVGPGKVAHLISTALQSLDSSIYLAVCGRNLERAEAFAEQFGLKTYTDVAERVGKEKLDLVIVCTANQPSLP